MKKSVVIAGLLSLSFSVSVFAEQYTGKGIWKSTSGQSGTYTANAVVEAKEDGITITETINLADQSFYMTYFYKKTDDTFFTVMLEGTVVGKGYCWPLEDAVGSKVCHSDTEFQGYKGESTVKVVGKTIFNIGSKTMPNGETIIWKDMLQAVAK